MVEIKANALDPQVAKEKSGKRYVLKSLAFSRQVGIKLYLTEG